jgi:hypothetical protein
MNGWKKSAAYLGRRLRRIKQWHLGLVFLVLLIIVIFGLRQNNLTMVDLRAQVIAADQALDWPAVDASAETLRSYVSQHMNANTGQIALQNLYNRDVKRALETAQIDIDSSAYLTATETCRAQVNQSGYQGYAACVAESVGTSDAQLQALELPSPTLYYISFASPRLSFDLAGVCLALMIVVFFTLLFRFLTGVILGVAVRNRNHF